MNQDEVSGQDEAAGASLVTDHDVLSNLVAARGAGVIGFLTRTETGSPRTAGIVVVGDDLDQPIVAEAMSPLLDCLRVENAAASGKIAIVDRSSEAMSVYQRMPNGSVQIAWCGNAVAAALATTSARRLTVIGPRLRTVLAAIEDPSQAGPMKWTVPGLPAVPLDLVQGGLRSVVLDTFNTYVVTHGLRDNELPVVGSNAKVMHLDLSSSMPVVRVRVAGRWHGALPITAGAELTLARPYIEWLDAALQIGAVLTTSGEIEPLPTVEYGSSSFALTFAPRLVEIVPLRMEAA